MIHTIENDYLKVSVDDHGAELCSIFDKVHNREVIWQADPAYWKRHAPVLFPNVGRHFEEHYRINGTEYPSKQHGFARDSEFTCVDMTADSITHKLKSSDATRENYPYDFELKIKHVLEKNQVSVCWKSSITAMSQCTLQLADIRHSMFLLTAALTIKKITC